MKYELSMRRPPDIEHFDEFNQTDRRVLEGLFYLREHAQDWIDGYVQTHKAKNEDDPEFPALDMKKVREIFLNEIETELHQIKKWSVFEE